MPQPPGPVPTTLRASCSSWPWDTEAETLGSAGMGSVGMAGTSTSPAPPATAPGAGSAPHVGPVVPDLCADARRERGQQVMPNVRISHCGFGMLH